jgi:hypothetical protein
MAEASPANTLDIETLKKQTEATYNRNKFLLAGIFVSGLIVLTVLWYFAPALSDDD